jgi:hypothetical protein
MPINAENFARAAVLAEVPPALLDDGSETPRAVRIEDKLREGQVFLGVGEVFATDLTELAFISSDGVDLRGPLALHNLRTATNLVNWLDTDTVVRSAWGVDRELPGKLASELGADLPAPDTAWLQSVFARLTRDNPPPDTQAEAEQRYALMRGEVESANAPRMLSSAPAATWLSPQGQLALRLWYIGSLARDFTAAEMRLDEFWFKTAAEQNPELTRETFQRTFNVDLQGISGADRGVAGLGNFFRRIGRSVSRLFRQPLRWARNALRELGKVLEFSAEPFGALLDFMGEQIGMPHLFQHPVRLLMRELGNVLQEGRITAFNEQAFVFDLGMHFSQAGALLGMVGGVLSAAGVPFGPIIAAAGAIMVAVGQGMIQMQQLVRQQRLARELAAEGAPNVTSPSSNIHAMDAHNAGAHAESGHAGGSGGGAGAGGALLLVLAALAMGGG